MRQGREARSEARAIAQVAAEETRDRGTATSHEEQPFDPVAVNSRFLNMLERMREDLANQSEADGTRGDLIFANVRSFAIAMSTGFLAALLRGGSLIALAFSSLPLWKGFNPLAILAMPGMERKRRKDELKNEEGAKDRGLARLFDDSQERRVQFRPSWLWSSEISSPEGKRSGSRFTVAKRSFTRAPAGIIVPQTSTSQLVTRGLIGARSSSLRISSLLGRRGRGRAPDPPSGPATARDARR